MCHNKSKGILPKSNGGSYMAKSKINTENKNTIQSVFGELIKLKRKQKQFTQEELSELVGITDVYLRDLERGSYTATWIICLRLCDALDIDIRDIQKKYIHPDVSERWKNMEKSKYKITN